MTDGAEESAGEAPQAAFGRNMREVRRSRGISQGQLVELLAERGLHLHRQSVQKIEKSGRPLKFDEAVLIAEVLNTDVEEMLQPAGEYGLYQSLRNQRTRLNYAQANLSTAVAEVGQALQRVSEARDALEASDWRDALDGQAHKAAEVELRAAADYLCEGRDDDPLEAITQKVIAEYHQGHHSTGYVSPEA